MVNQDHFLVSDSLSFSSDWIREKLHNYTKDEQLHIRYAFTLWLSTLTCSHTKRHTHTQPHFTALWHKMGFLCLSRGGPMATEDTSRGKGFIFADTRLDVSCSISDYLSPAYRMWRGPFYRRLDFRQHRKSLLPPAHSTALQEGLPHMHTEACIHAQSKQIHTWCSPKRL